MRDCDCVRDKESNSVRVRNLVSVRGREWDERKKTFLLLHLMKLILVNTFILFRSHFHQTGAVHCRFHIENSGIRGIINSFILVL